MRAGTSLISTETSGNFAELPKLTSPTAATYSPGGSGDTKGAGGTGRREHTSLPTRTSPSGDHTETTQQRDGGQPKGAEAKAAVNPLANLKGKAADRLGSSNSQVEQSATYPTYDEYDRHVTGDPWKVVQHQRESKPSEPKQLPPKMGLECHAFWLRHNEEHHRNGDLGCGVQGWRWETNDRWQLEVPNQPPQPSSSETRGSTSSRPRSAPSFARPQQTAGSTTTPKTPRSSSRKPQKGTTGSTSSSRQEEDSAMPEDFTPEPSQATGGPSSSSSGHTHGPRAQAPLPMRQYPSMCTRAQHRSRIQYGMEACY